MGNMGAGLQTRHSLSLKVIPASRQYPCVLLLDLSCSSTKENEIHAPLRLPVAQANVLAGVSGPLRPPTQILHTDLKGNSFMATGFLLVICSLASQTVSSLYIFKD